MVTERFTTPGEMIKDIADSRDINQKDLATRLGMSEKHISNLLNGKVRLTEGVAISLEKVFPDFKAAFWLKVESEYRESIKREEINQKLVNPKYYKEMSKRFLFDEVVENNLQLNNLEKANYVLELLGISDFDNFESNCKYVYNNASFFEDGGKIEPIILWLKKCERELFYQNPISVPKFKNSNLKNSIENFKKLILITNGEIAIKKLREQLNEIGIYLVIQKALKNSKVRGAVIWYEDNPVINLSLRFKKHDYIWFAFFHELAHIILHKNNRETIVSYDDEQNMATTETEEEANTYSRNTLLDKEEYNKFIKENEFTENKIRVFAMKQKTTPDIVLGRLQHDKLVEPSFLTRKLKYDML